MQHHQFYKYSLCRDPRRSFVFIIPETDRLFIVDPGKYLEDEEVISSSIDIYKTRHKDFVVQDENKTLKNIKKMLKRNGIIDNTTHEMGKTVTNTIQRGDMIQLEWIEYRNDGSYIWDGENVIQLNYDIDDYGSTPTEFSFPEFPFTYFENRIVHNNLINLSEELMEEAKANMNFDDFANLFPQINHESFNRKLVYSTFKYNQQKHIILGVPDELYDCDSSTEYYKEKFISLFKKGLNNRYITFEWEGLSTVFGNEIVLFNIC